MRTCLRYQLITKVSLVTDDDILLKIRGYEIIPDVYFEEEWDDYSFEEDWT